MKLNNTLTQEQLKKALSYNPESGEFIWIINTRNNYIGDKAGHLSKQGYIYIGINGKRYNASRLAWLYIYGKFPNNEIDHVNRDKSDNKITNLRDVKGIENCLNRKSGKTTNTGIPNINKRSSGKYRAYLTRYKTVIMNKTFNTIEEAEYALEEAKREYELKYSI